MPALYVSSRVTKELALLFGVRQVEVLRDIFVLHGIWRYRYNELQRPPFVVVLDDLGGRVAL